MFEVVGIHAEVVDVKFNRTGFWVEVQAGSDTGLRLWARLEEVDGHLRVVELHADGQGRPISNSDLRQVKISAAEVFGATNRRNLEANAVWKHGRGPDLGLLATAIGRSAPRFYGHFCDCCEAPLDTNGKAITDWVSLALMASFYDTQRTTFDGGREFPQPSKRAAQRILRQSLASEEVRLSMPDKGLTDQFLGEVAHAYEVATRRGLPQLVALALASGAPRNTVKSWVHQARKRDIMPPAPTRGRIN